MAHIPPKDHDQIHGGMSCDLGGLICPPSLSLIGRLALSGRWEGLMSKVRNVLALMCAFAGASGGCATREQTVVDLESRKDARHLTFESKLTYPDSYRSLLDSATKCFSIGNPLGLITGGVHTEVKGQIYPDNYAEITVHLMNPVTDWVVGMARIRPAQSGSTLEVVVRFRGDVRLWANLAEGNPCNAKH